MYLLCKLTLGTNVTYNPHRYYTLRYVVYNIYMQPKLVLHITGLTHLLPKVSNVIINKMDKNEGN